jgi:hypothetical protein
MTKQKIESECELLKRFYEQELLRRCPYEEVREAQEWDRGFPDLGLHLSLYFARIAGYCTWGKRMISWSAERRAAARSDCCLSFFDEHPRYVELIYGLELFTELKREMDVYDDARKRVLALISEIEEYHASASAE